MLAKTFLTTYISATQNAYARRAYAARRNNLKAQAGKERSGYFSEADPKAEVYPVKSGTDIDITKRGGRYQPEFIWNVNWQDKLDYEDSIRRQQQEGSQEEEDDQPGKLRLASKIDLNSMDVDLTAQLLARKKSATEASSSSSSQQGNRNLRRASRPALNPPTRLEQKAWARGGKFSKKVVAVAPTNAGDEEQRSLALEAEQQRYDELKAELQAWAAGLTIVCFSATYAFYGRDVAASYGVGALGGLVYLRLLTRTMDSFGEGLGGALGQPRLLIPVILTLGYNRYNTMLAEEIGLTLQLLPMLVGFFTYKGAVVAKQSLSLFAELSASSQPKPEGGEQDEGDAGSKRDVASVDRAFNKRVLSR